MTTSPFRQLLLASLLALAVGSASQAVAQVATPLVVQGESGPVQVYEDSRALIIAESSYTAPSWPRLDQVPTEAMHIEDALRTHGYRTTVASNLGQIGLEQTIKNFLNSKVTFGTRLLVFFAGHGWSDENGGYIVPVDAPGSGEDDFRSKIVSMQDMLNWSYGSRARHVTFVFDSCFSGAVFLTRSNLRPSTLFLSDLDNSVRMIVTSGSASEQVPAGMEFGRLFVEGLNGAADLVPDGVITGSELGYWLKVRVAAQGRQTPQFGTSQQVKYKIGDVVMSTVTTVAPGREATVLARALPSKPSGETMRAAEVRNLGVPDRASASVFAGIEVKYSRKKIDGDKVIHALDPAGIPYVQSRNREEYPQPVNSIICSGEVPVAAVRKLAATLIGSGIKLLAIFEQQIGPTKLMVVGTQPDLAQKLRPLTLHDLDGLQRCSATRKL
jgi:hypothetical protein